jgi:hypothetical protein
MPSSTQVGLLGVSLLMLGCVSSYTPHTDDQPVASGDSTEHCRYSFATDNLSTWFRASSVYAYEWGHPEDFGYDNVQPLPGLIAACPDPGDAPKTEARVETYYLEYSNAAVRITNVLFNLAMFPYTFGFLPTPSTDHYAVCLQVTADDGMVRKGLVNGKLKSFTNIWGSGNTRANQGETDRKNAKEQLMRDLSIQAWQQAWAAPQEDVPPATLCLQDMDTIRAR